jgi:hypothetical protein
MPTYWTDLPTSASYHVRVAFERFLCVFYANSQEQLICIRFSGVFEFFGCFVSVYANSEEKHVFISISCFFDGFCMFCVFL